jgi:hypothetical protein
MSWTRERDLLIAQTLMFVQSVTGKKPEAQARPETRIAFVPLDEIERVERPVEIIEATVDEAVHEIAPAPRPSPAPRSGMREEIMGRVAAFQAHQRLFSRERDEYFKSVLTKARASIESQSRPSRD